MHRFGNNTKDIALNNGGYIKNMPSHILVKSITENEKAKKKMRKDLKKK